PPRIQMVSVTAIHWPMPPAIARKANSSTGMVLAARCSHVPCSSGENTTPSRPSTSRGSIPPASRFAGRMTSTSSTRYSTAVNPSATSAAAFGFGGSTRRRLSTGLAEVVLGVPGSGGVLMTPGYERPTGSSSGKTPEIERPEPGSRRALSGQSSAAEPVPRLPGGRHAGRWPSSVTGAPPPVWPRAPAVAVQLGRRLVRRTRVGTGGQILPPGIGDHERDVGALTGPHGLLRRRQRRVQHRTGRNAREDALQLEQLPRAAQRVISTDGVPAGQH